MKLLRHWHDLDFTVEAEVESHRVNFRIFEIVGETADGLEWHAAENNGCHPVPTTKLEEAEVYMHGFVKWDGCSEWNTAPVDEFRHSCSRRQLVAQGEVMARCWDWTGMLLPNWDDNPPRTELFRETGAQAVTLAALKEHLASTADVTLKGKPVEIWMQLDEEVAPRRVQQVYRHTDGRILFSDADLD